MTWAFVFLGWSALGLLLTVQAWVYNDNDTQPFLWARNALYRLTPQWVWAALTPFLAWVVRRVFLSPGGWRRGLLALVALSVLIAPLHRLASIVLHFGILALTAALPAGLGAAVSRARLAILGGSLDSWIMYWTILLVLFALRYHERLRTEQVRASRLETQLAESRLQALRMQLHPHFLFNTLHTIATLVDEDAAAARAMIARLGDLLRTSLDDSAAQEVPLEEELQTVEKYLAIETVRFQNRLTIDIEVPPDVRAARVPSFLLQPLVENAIRHGFAPRSEPGTLRIRAARRDGTLHVVVQDDGVGASRPSRPGSGVGLRNIRARLDQLYGAGARLETEAGENGGFAVRVEIPFRTAVAPEPAGRLRQ